MNRSLGCIVYEMMVGVPPFTTTSILQLVRMIRYDPISWPPYLSEKCQHLLQGLLQKNPSQRLSWPHLLHHPFLQNKVSSSIESGLFVSLMELLYLFFRTEVKIELDSSALFKFSCEFKQLKLVENLNIYFELLLSHSIRVNLS